MFFIELRVSSYNDSFVVEHFRPLVEKNSSGSCDDVFPLFCERADAGRYPNIYAIQGIFTFLCNRADINVGVARYCVIFCGQELLLLDIILNPVLCHNLEAHVHRLKEFHRPRELRHDEMSRVVIEPSHNLGVHLSQIVLMLPLIHIPEPTRPH